MRRAWPKLFVAVAVATVLSLALAPRGYTDSGPDVTVSPGSQVDPLGTPRVEVDVVIAGVAHLGAYDVGLAYDAAVVQFVSFEDGGFLGSSGTTPQCFRDTNQPAVSGQLATVRWGCTTPGSVDGPGVSGSGTLARFIFRPVAAGTSPIHFTFLDLAVPEGRGIPVGSYQDGVVAVLDANATVPAGSVAAPTRVSGGLTPTFVVPAGAATPLPPRSAATPLPGRAPSGDTGTGAVGSDLAAVGDGPVSGPSGSDARGAGVDTTNANRRVSGAGSPGSRSGPVAGTGLVRHAPTALPTLALLTIAGCCIAVGLGLRVMAGGADREVSS